MILDMVSPPAPTSPLPPLPSNMVLSGSGQLDPG